MGKHSDEQFRALADQLAQQLPGVYLEVIEDDELPGGFYIGLLSNGPDYKPDVTLPQGWLFSGWRNPDQRNNMGVIKKSLEE